MNIFAIVFQSVALALVLVTTLISQKSTRSEFAISLFFQNGLFFPLIIISGFFGSDSSHAVLLFIFIIFHPPDVHPFQQVFSHPVVFEEEVLHAVGRGRD